MITTTYRGQVRCGKIYHFRDTSVSDKTHPTIPGFVNINVTSGGNSRFKALSPMKLGPFDMTEVLKPMLYYPTGVLPGCTQINNTHQNMHVEIFENIWQGSKVYAVDLVNNLVQPSFFERRAKMARDHSPHRRALPKAGNTVVTSYWNGNFYPYVQSRYFYCFYYIGLVSRTPEYAELVNMVNSGVNVHILGFDGRDIPITAESMLQAIFDPTYPFGHELVLCCLLTGLAPWNSL